MPKYMVQKMESGTHTPITYYRKQRNPHPSHGESGAFTTAAKNAYAAAVGVLVSAVVAGTYRSGQGVPQGGQTEEI